MNKSVLNLNDFNFHEGKLLVDRIDQLNFAFKCQLLSFKNKKILSSTDLKRLWYKHNSNRKKA